MLKSHYSLIKYCSRSHQMRPCLCPRRLVAYSAVFWRTHHLTSIEYPASFVRRSFSDGGSIQHRDIIHYSLINYSRISLAPCGVYLANLLFSESSGGNRCRLDGRRSRSPLSAAPPRLSSSQSSNQAANLVYFHPT